MVLTTAFKKTSLFSCLTFPYLYSTWPVLQHKATDSEQTNLSNFHQFLVKLYPRQKSKHLSIWSKCSANKNGTWYLSITKDEKLPIWRVARTSLDQISSVEGHQHSSLYQNPGWRVAGDLFSFQCFLWLTRFETKTNAFWLIFSLLFSSNFITFDTLIIWHSETDNTEWITEERSGESSRNVK